MFRQESMYWLTGYDTFGYVFFQTLVLDKSGNIIVEKWRNDISNNYGLRYTEFIAPMIKSIQEVDASLNNVGKGLEWTTSGLGVKTGAGLALDGDTLYSTTTGTRWALSSGKISYSSGNVGLGTTDPSSILHLYKKNQAGGTILYIEADGGTGAMPAGQPFSGLCFKSNDGIATAGSNTAPVSGTDASYESSRIISGWTNGDQAWNQSWVKFQTHSANTSALTDDMIIKGGKVGIRNNSPDGALHIKETDSSTDCKLILESPLSSSQDAMIIFSHGKAMAGEGQQNSTWAIGFDNDGTPARSFSIAYKENGYDGVNLTSDRKITITATGRLGIGEANPDKALEVAGDILATGDITAFYNSSDKNLKTNIETIENPIEILKNIRGVRFNWNDEAKAINENVDLEKKELGVIAQEVEEEIPEIMKEGLSGYKAVRYEKLTPLLIEGMKKQQEQIEKQQKEIDELKELVKQLLENK